MTKDLEVFSELFSACKTIMLPRHKSDCYAVYSREKNQADEYKHRLYFYKKLNNKPKTLSIITLTPNMESHINHNLQRYEKYAETYGALEIYSIFTLRTDDVIDALLEDAILDITRIDFGKNDILLDLGEELVRTEKHKNLPDEELQKINKVRQIKINALLKFLKQSFSDNRISAL